MENNENKLTTIEQQASLIESVDIENFKNMMQKIQTMQKFVQANLKKDHDYGIIPNTRKPTLFKAGAEKILMLYGVQSRFDIIESTTNEEIVEYTFRCTLSRNGMDITEGYGTSNSKEAKYFNQPSYNVKNTVLKIARKRSLTDAVLTVASLSDLFTQDLEDDIHGDKIAEQKQTFTDRSGLISNAQARRMYAKSQGNQELCLEVMGEFGYENTKEIEKINYDAICDEIEKRVKMESSEDSKEEEQVEETDVDDGEEFDEEFNPLITP